MLGGVGKTDAGEVHGGGEHKAARIVVLGVCLVLESACPAAGFARTAGDVQSCRHESGKSVQQAAHLGRDLVVTHGVDNVGWRHTDGVVLL